jgi:hypothetical protein
MIRNGKRVAFKAARHNPKMCSYELVDFCSRCTLQQLQEEEVNSIQEVEASELPKLAYFADLDVGDFYSSHQIGEHMSVKLKK